MLSLLKRIPVSLWALLLIPAVHLIYIISQWHHVPLRDGLPIGQTDPDTWLRLTLVREWLTGGDWYNHWVPRANAPFEASASPWTRPVDLVLAFFVYLQPKDIDLSLRIMRASLLLPWLWMFLLIAGMHRAIRLILPIPSAYVMATVLIATTPVLINYFGLGNADHHAPLAVLFIWAMGGILAAAPTSRMMALSGLCFGLQLWISVEAFMLIGVAYLWFGLQWLRGDEPKTHLFTILASTTAITSLVALMIEVPRAQWLAPVYDSISIVYVYSLVIAALAAWSLRFLMPSTFHRRALLGLVITSLAMVAIGAFYPNLLRGPLYGVDPFIISDFLPRISEAKSFLHISIAVLIAYSYLAVALVILCGMAWLKPSHAFYTREQSATLIFFLLATLALYYSQQRWSYYLMPLTIVSAAPLLGALLKPEHPLVAGRWPARALASLSPNAQMKRRLPVLLIALGLPLIIIFASDIPLFQNETKAEQIAAKQRNSCYNAARQLIRSGELNRLLPTSLTLWAPTDLGTEILFFTPHRIIASNYHREGAAIKYVWDTNKISNVNALRTHLAKRKVDAMLICPMIEFTKDSLVQKYALGAALPAWLEPVTYKLTTPQNEIEEDGATISPPLLVKVKQH